MPAGAALPKDLWHGRESIKGNVRGVCEHFPACTGYAYASADAWRRGTHWTCPDCGARMVVAHPAACMILRPDMLDYHPCRDELSRLTALPAEEWKGEPCASCGHERASHLDPDLWYCRKCWGVNERQADGTLGWFKAAPFSPEAEKCNGLARDRKVAPSRKVATGPERVGAVASDPIPF